MIVELSAAGDRGQGQQLARATGVCRTATWRGRFARRAAALCLALAALAFPQAARAAAPGLSDWASGGHSRARLLALGPSATGGAKRQAAVEIELDPGFLTYWRNPGEAGLPPTLDTTESDNVAAVAVDFPAPALFEEAGVPLYGYRTRVTLPLEVELADPARPATLAVTLDYAVCSTICLPGKVALRLALPGTSDPAVQALIEAAKAAVPRRVTLGAPGPRGIDHVDREGRGLTVSARGELPASLFVEAPEGWFLTAHAPKPGEAGTLRFAVSIDGAPAGDAGGGPLDLRLTLVDAHGAVEVPVRVDVGARTP